MLVFIIDDDPFYTSIIERQLLNHQVEKVRHYQTVEEAMKNLPLEMPGMLFMDLHLENQNTIDNIQTIKQGYPQLYLIAMSSSGDEKTKTKCLDNGAFYFLDKNRDLNFSIRKILEEVNKYSELFR